MKLLIIAQSVDKNNPVLGFFVRWIEEFSKRFESIVVICLEKGECDLPVNVKVLSLGKENGASKIKYLFNFYKYIWQERKNYDAVFVHMNQEYIILGWKIWFLLRKKIYMWRNHGAGNWLTDVASFFCTKVFCTSKFSYTAKYKKTIIMSVGIDTEKFKITNDKSRIKNSILFLGRIAPVKKPHILLEALKILKEKHIDFTASFYGDPSPKDLQYYESLKVDTKSFGLSSTVSFYPGVPNDKTPEIYATHEIFVNLSPSGMYDKTIFEAMACNAIVLSCNKNLCDKVDPRLLFEEDNASELASKIEAVLSLNPEDISKILLNNRNFVTESHSLKSLTEKLEEVLQSS